MDRFYSVPILCNYDHYLARYKKRWHPDRWMRVKATSKKEASMKVFVGNCEAVDFGNIQEV